MSLAPPYAVPQATVQPATAVTPSLIPARLVLSILWQGRFFLVFCVVLACIFTFALRKMVPAEFPAQVQIFVDPAGLDLIDPGMSRADQAQDQNLYQVETIRHFIRSTEVLGPLVRDLALDRDPEFVEGGALAPVRRLLLGGAVRADSDRAMAELRRKTAVQRLENSFVLELVALSQDGDKAARIANALAASMIREVQQRQAARLKEAENLFSGRREALSGAVQEAGNAVATARAGVDRIGAERETVLEQELRETADSLARERLRRIEAASRLTRLTQAKDAASRLDAASALDVSETLSQLQRDMALARARSLDLQARLGPRHPQVQSQQARIDSLSRQIGEEADRLVATAKADHEAAITAEKAQERRFEALKARQTASATGSKSLNETVRKAASLTEASEALRLAQTRAETRRSSNDQLFRIVSDALPTTSPWRLASSKTLPLVALAALLVGMAWLLFPARWPAGVIFQPLMAARPLPPFLVMLFIIMTVIMATSAFYPLVAQKNEAEFDAGSTARGNIGYVLVWVGLYGVAGMMFLRDALQRGVDRGLLAAFPIIGFIMLSAIWSDRPTDAAYFSTLLCANILIAYVLAQIVAPERFLVVMTQTLMVILVLSLVFLAVAPDRALSWSDGRGWFITKEFSGLFSHKLHSGTYAAMALMLMVFVSPRPLNSLTLLAGIAVTVLTMALANSATAVVAVVMVSGMLLWAHGTRSFTLVLVSGLGLLAFSVLAPMVNLGAATQIVGRDANLTGRGSFWKLAWDFAAERPFGGYGYTTFFDRNAFSPVWQIYDYAANFFTPNFHNSSLDIVISFGLIGLALYLVIAFTALMVVKNTTLAPSTRLVLAGLVIFFTISSTFDFQFMRHNSVPTILLFYVFFLARRDCRDHSSLSAPPLA